MFSTEDVELLDPCVICYETEDEDGNLPVKSTEFLDNISCRCEYMVHSNCIRQWLITRPRTYPHYKVRCLLCSSTVEKKRSSKEKFMEFCTLSMEAKRQLCRYGAYMGGMTLLMLITFGGHH